MLKDGSDVRVKVVLIVRQTNIALFFHLCVNISGGLSIRGALVEVPNHTYCFFIYLRSLRILPSLWRTIIEKLKVQLVSNIQPKTYANRMYRYLDKLFVSGGANSLLFYAYKDLSL